MEEHSIEPNSTFMSNQYDTSLILLNMLAQKVFFPYALYLCIMCEEFIKFHLQLKFFHNCTYHFCRLHQFAENQQIMNICWVHCIHFSCKWCTNYTAGILISHSHYCLLTFKTKKMHCWNWISRWWSANVDICVK